VRGCEAVAEARRKTAGTKFDDEIGLLGCGADAAEKSEDEIGEAMEKGKKRQEQFRMGGPEGRRMEEKGVMTSYIVSC
jgi:hypothetical protein